ncbi:MAG: GAF domain-containing protein [Anaerolineae bacterium]|nr:GAF domain-containing protein [Anaerolineae bacterium]
MWKWFLNLFKPPVFLKNDEKTRVARTLHQILIVSWSLPVLALVIILFDRANIILVPVAVIFAAAILSLMAMNRAGRVRLSGIIYILFLIFIITYVDTLAGSDAPRPALILITSMIIIISGLLLGGNAPILVAIILMTIRIILSTLGEMGLIVGVVPPPSVEQEMLTIGIGYLLIAVLFRQSTTSIQSAAEKLRESQRALETTNIELSELTKKLEQRVVERTGELGAANAKNERRAAQFEAIAQVSRTISSTQDLNTLLPQITSVISRLFGFYHVGIFLIDSKGEYAVLSAANSEGGQNMLARHHRLKVGEVGIVGYVTSTGNPRVALDTGSDVVFFNNPDLPHTRSEIALPFKVGGQVIGALDVQSKEPNAFAEEDISILSILSEQVGIAIQNSRQYEETRRALAESEMLSRQFVQRGWQQFTKSRNLAGIRHTGARATLLYSKNSENKDEGQSTRDQVLNDSRDASLVLPVKLRDEVIGTVNVRTPGNREWDQDELDIVTAIIERAAVSLENARLLAESQKRAAKERTIGEISAKISAQSDIDQLLKTAAQELGRTLPKANISIQFKKEDESG